MEIKIINFTKEYILQVERFADKHIGKNYYSPEQLEEIIEKSILGANNCSFLIFKDGELKGIRLSYMPGKWRSVKGTNGLTPNSWNGLKIEELGYFQSLFLHPDLMNQSWGPVLSNLSIDQMRQAGAKGIITHSWLESPNNSSRKYLEKIGFKLIKKHKLYWIKVDYECTRCGKPCVCTAGEMLKILEET